MMELADFANASKELKAIEESNAILDYNLLKDLKLVNAEYSMIKVDSRGYAYTNNETMLCYIFKKLFHRELSEMTKFHWDPSWIYDEYSGPRSLTIINEICKHAQEKYLNIEVLKDAFRSLFFHEMEDNILFAYCDNFYYYYTDWLDLKYKKQKRNRKMIDKKSKKVMYHNFLDDLDVLKATYADVSDEIKKLLDRASEQANMELRKEEKKNG